MEGDLPNFSQKWVKYFLLSQRMDMNMILFDLHEMEKDERRNGKRIAFYSFILSLLHRNKASNGELDDMEMAVFHMRRAMESCSSFFKGRDNFISAYLQFQLAGMLLPISFDNQETAFHLHAALSAFRNSGFNPFILINILRLGTSIPNDFNEDQNGSNLNEIMTIQKMLGMVGSLKNFYTQALRSFQSSNASF